MRFKNKIVLVTGATQNTGLAIAALFLKEGAHVCINGPCEASVVSGAQVLREAGYTEITECAADISDPVQVEQMFQKIAGKFKRMDILINNACHQGIGASFCEMDPAYFAAVLNTNVLGTFQVSQQAVKLMLAAGGDKVIVNLGSNVSERPIHNRIAYVASKGGVDALTRAMAIDLAPLGVRVNMVAPGYIRTDRWNVLPPETAERRRKNAPSGTESMAEDIAEAVAFLASPAARNICGERLVVDGGCSIQLLPVDIDK